MKAILFLITFLFTFLQANANDSIKLEIKVPDVVALGDQFRLQYTINTKCDDLTLSDQTGDFEFLFGPALTRSETNGANTTTFTYIIKSLKLGSYRTPGASVKVDGKIYSCDGLEIKVLSAGVSNKELSKKQDDNAKLFIKQEVSPKKVFEGEPVKVVRKIYTRRDITHINDMDYPAFDGCWVDQKDDTIDVQFMSEEYDGTSYLTAVLREYTLYPLHSGNLIVDDFSFDYNYKRESGQKVQTFFGEQPVYESKRDTLYVSADTIQVVALPDNTTKEFKGIIESNLKDVLGKQLRDKSEIVLAIDISSSMLAEDFTPNRLEVTKNIIKEFRDKLPKEKTGLVLFAGKSYTWTANIKTLAPDPDYKLFVPDSLFKDGTAIGMGLLSSVNLLNADDSPRSIVLVTDGTNNMGNLSPFTAADIARQKGINLFIIGMGGIGKARTPAKVKTPVDTTIYIDVETKIDDKTLEKMASMTGGRYYRAIDNKSFDAAVRQIMKLLPEARRPDVEGYEYIRPENIRYILDALNRKGN
jgi:Mg-chelatase subunit ChlD